jgi:hypothetical protein
MQNRKGEKFGWIGGWMGGFIWLFLLAIFWFIQGNLKSGIGAVILFLIAIICIFTFAPWKHPKTKYWKLMLPIYSIFIIALAACVYFYEGFNAIAMKWYSFFWILPCFIPFVTAGSRSWTNNN